MPKTPYVDQRLYEAIDKAATILAANMDKWSNVVEAYWLLRRKEDEIGFPLTYNMVVEAVEKARMIAARERPVAFAEA